MTHKIKRRSFLGLGATALAGMAFPNILLPTQKKQIGVALVGLGSYSTYQLAPALQQTNHCQLKGIVTGSPEKIPTWQQRYRIPDHHVYTYETMGQIAENEEIDVIYIVTPTGTHKDFVLKAAETGKHVWCEKPMAMTAAECQEMISACKKNKVQLTIGYRVQHEPNTRELNSYAASLPFGKMVNVSSAAGYRGGGGSGWRFEKAMGGGALYDMGVYTVNGIRNATKIEPIEVISARQYSDRPSLFQEVDETTTYKLLLSNGMEAKGRTSVGDNINHLRVTCEKGWYEMRPMQTYSGVSGSRSDGIRIDTFLPNQQAKQMDDDALALLQGEEFQIDPIEGLRDIAVIEAIIKAAETDRSVKL